MKTLVRGLVLGLLLPLCSSLVVRATSGAAEMYPDDVLLSMMQKELQRATSKLMKLDPAPYFTSYSVYDVEGNVVVEAELTAMIVDK